MTVSSTDFKGIPLLKKGKVRDVYTAGENLLIVATDRISAFDVILPTPIPDKGKVLTRISQFWFDYLKPSCPNHLISTDLKNLPKEFMPYHDILNERFMLTRKAKVLPFECVVRGYLAGSGWAEYKKNQSICGIPLPKGLNLSAKLEEPIFTPATKAEVGHDENVDFDYMRKTIGEELALKIKNLSITLYKKAAEYAEAKGIIIADTKFEFGIIDQNIILIDEVLTPDSSRFWPQDDYQEGVDQKSLDKQFVRDYLETLTWNKQYPGPNLPNDIVEKTHKKYVTIAQILTGVTL